MRLKSLGLLVSKHTPSLTVSQRLSYSNLVSEKHVETRLPLLERHEYDKLAHESTLHSRAYDIIRAGFQEYHQNFSRANKFEEGKSTKLSRLVSHYADYAELTHAADINLPVEAGKLSRLFKTALQHLRDNELRKTAVSQGFEEHELADWELAVSELGAKYSKMNPNRLVRVDEECNDALFQASLTHVFALATVLGENKFERFHSRLFDLEMLFHEKLGLKNPLV